MAAAAHTANTKVELERLTELCHASLQQDVPRAVDISVLRLVISHCQATSCNPAPPLQKRLLDVALLLLEGLARGQFSTEEQLLSSCAFCSVLAFASFSEEATNLLSACLSVSRQAKLLVFVSSTDTFSVNLQITNPEKFKVCLCHGLLQCRHSCVSYVRNLHHKIFEVLEESCRVYCRLTIIAFKCVTLLLEKVKHFNIGQCVDGTRVKRVFSVVSTNWENPISGVRKENSKILELLCDLCDAASGEEEIVDMFRTGHLLPSVLREQSWKLKSKYFMLAVLLPKYGVAKALSEFPTLAKALVSSVGHTYLVSAGCDVYRACLKHLNKESQWYRFFLQPVVELLTSDSSDDVSKENLYNYWLTATVKHFPTVLPALLQQLASRRSAVLLPLISLIHLGRKEGLVHDLWDGAHCRVDLLDAALQHPNEMVRNHAFAAVCVHSKTTVFPSRRELETIKNFLIQNANSDCPPLRQSILNSFTCFLLRFRDSFLQEMKKGERECRSVANHKEENCSEELKRALEFLEWLHSFCVSNLEPGSNYQRKLLSLRVFQEVLNYLNDDRKEGLRRKGGVHGQKVKDFALRHGKWHFGSDSNARYLTACIMDPTDDIRELAASIFVQQLKNSSCRTVQVEALLRRGLDLCSSQMFYETESGASLIEVAASMAPEGRGHDVSLRLCRSCSRLQSESHVHGELLAISRPVELSSQNKEVNDDREPRQMTNAVIVCKADVHIPICNSQAANLQTADCRKGNIESENPLSISQDLPIKVVTTKFPSNPGTSKGLLAADPDTISVPSMMFERLAVIGGEVQESLCESKEEHVKDDKPLRSLTFKQEKSLPVSDGNIRSDPPHLPVMGARQVFEISSTQQLYVTCDVQHSSVHPGKAEGNSSKKSPQMHTQGAHDVQFWMQQRRDRPVLPADSDGRDDKCTCNRKTFQEGDTKPVTPTGLLNRLLREAWLQWQVLEADVCRAALHGAPLHGLLNAIVKVLRKSSCVTLFEVQQTLLLIESVVQHLLTLLTCKSSDMAVAPSFAEMSSAIEHAIQQSYSGAESSRCLSPAHQLVLNCMWLNLKACCVLASVLAVHRTTPAPLVEPCEKVIVQVLTRCRHKGAIEAAGVALADLVKAITSAGESRVTTMADGQQLHVRHLPGLLLRQFLDSLDGGSGRISTTRRSAGLAILLHKIVANDMQPGKPLLEYCMQRLLCVARMPLNDLGQLEHLTYDLPQAQALHFLRTLMQDSSLRQDMALFVDDISLLCFHNFTSPVWTIRNAALQLFGALVPKLVGEKKFQGDDDDNYSNITVEEFLEHHHELCRLLPSMLSAGVHQPNSSLAQHSSVIPVLSLLSKLSLGGHAPMGKSQRIVDVFKEYFIKLLSSRISTVRKISAKAYSRYLLLSEITPSVSMFVTSLLQQKLNDNEIHGRLLVLKYLKERLQCEEKSSEQCLVEAELGQLSKIPSIDMTSWLNKALIVTLCNASFAYSKETVFVPATTAHINRILYTLQCHTSKGQVSPGIHHWARTEALSVFQSCPEERLCAMWPRLYCSNWDDICIDYLLALKVRFSHEKQKNCSARNDLINSLLVTVQGIRWIKSFELLLQIYNTLVYLVMDHSLGFKADLLTVQTLIMENCDGKENGSECRSVALPLSCALLSSQVDDLSLIQVIHVLSDIVNHILIRTDTHEYEEMCRLNAAKGFCLMYQIIPRLLRKHRGKSENQGSITHSVCAKLVDAGIALLQDENSEVRKEAASFTATYSSDRHEMPRNPYACLEELLAGHSLLRFFPLPQAMLYLLKKLASVTCCRQNIVCSVVLEQDASPFDHGIANIYAEEIQIVHMCGRNLLRLVQSADDRVRRELDDALHVAAVEEDVRELLELASRGRRSGEMHTGVAAAAALHTLHQKLVYLLRLKQSLNGRETARLEHLISTCHKHTKDF